MGASLTSGQHSAAIAWACAPSQIKPVHIAGSAGPSLGASRSHSSLFPEQNFGNSIGFSILVTAVVTAARQRHRTLRQATGGPPASAKRVATRLKKARREEKFGKVLMRDKNRPPPALATPKSGAWTEGRPENENLRQGEFRSPWTNQVYDRWAPIGLKQTGTDRQGGLGRARAYETPKQQQIREALEQEGGKNVPEWQKFQPGLAPPHLLPAKMRETGLPAKFKVRHAQKAGNFADIFKQLIVQTVVDLKVQKQDKVSPIWYVETCCGEGEYHVQRLQKVGEERPPPQWPTSEDFFSCLQDQDLTYMPAEIRGWMDSVRMLNSQTEGFEVQGLHADADPSEAIQWLPSTALVALRLLRKQDPVTLYEDHPVSFAALLNFVRNWSSGWQPHVELCHRDGMKAVRYRFIDREKCAISKVHGQLSGHRGIVFIDADWNRGSEAQRCKALITRLRKHWRAATVMVTYPLGPDFEHKARNFNKEVREADRSLDLVTVEIFVDNKNWHPGSQQAKWRGYGVLMSSPPHTTIERCRAALTIMCEELGKMEGSSPMHVTVEQL
jgi:23S rRNA A2030 N6-methylase RlmJ